MIIEFSIGLLVVAVLSYLFFDWKSKANTRKLLKKYDDTKDKSRQGEEESRRLRETDVSGRTATAYKTELSSAGLSEPEGRSVLPTAEAIVDGKTSSSNRKGSRLARIFKRRR